MCCRYYFDDDTIKDIQNIVKEVDERIRSVKPGDIHPSEIAPVITGRNPTAGLRAEAMHWGFSRLGKNLRMINARSESVLTTPSFSESVMRRRCVIPAGHFYEWDSQKVKNTFRHPDRRTFYMAGFYDIRENQEQFVILTRDANASMKPVHDRMPLIFSEEQVEEWIREDDRLEEFLRMDSPEMMRECEYAQMSLWDLM